MQATHGDPEIDQSLLGASREHTQGAGKMKSTPLGFNRP
jgi:hypothetical protein